MTLTVLQLNNNRLIMEHATLLSRLINAARR